MRKSKDRRDPDAKARILPEDNDREPVLSDRRKASDRRIENLAAEERQLLLSELPWPTLHKQK